MSSSPGNNSILLINRSLLQWMCTQLFLLYINFINNFGFFSLPYEGLCNILSFDSWFAKPQIFTTWHFTEKAVWPPIAGKPQNIHITDEQQHKVKFLTCPLRCRDDRECCGKRRQTPGRQWAFGWALKARWGGGRRRERAHGWFMHRPARKANRNAEGLFKKQWAKQFGYLRHVLV